MKTFNALLVIILSFIGFNALASSLDSNFDKTSKTKIYEDVKPTSVEKPGTNDRGEWG